MEPDLKKTRRHNAYVLGVVLILSLLCLLGIVLTYLAKPVPTINNYVGKPGAPGLSVTGPQGPSGIQGVSGLSVQGPTGPQGSQGIAGANASDAQVVGAVSSYLQTNPPAAGAQGDQGPTGDPGQNGRDPEFRCNPSNHDYEWRYVGDEDWQTLQKNSRACYQAVL